nr:IPT/TIG domain-containing protein [uncultured Flavobacterium sp.]
MKNIKTKYILPFFTTAVMALGLFSSCDNESDSGTTLAITSVVKAQEGDLTPVTQGDPKNFYIIRGIGFSTVQKIYFNDFDTYFNPVLVTDTEIFVLIDENTPYANASNKLKVVTQIGTAEFNFVIAPPSPTLSSFNPINAVAGDEVVIKGRYFLNPTVTIGTESVPVISSSLEEIKIKLPAGADKKYITVTNISGSAVSKQAIGTAIYDDVYRGMEWGGPWSNYPVDLAYTTDVYQGKNSIQYQFGGWSGLGMGFTSVSLAPYKAIRIAVKGAKEGTLKVVVSGNWGAAYSVPVTTQWVSVEINLSDIGNPTDFNQLVMQESGNFGGNTILVDDIGFVLK